MNGGVPCMVRGEIPRQVGSDPMKHTARRGWLGPWPEVGGGQIWTQTAFPCFSYLVTLVGSRHDVGYKGDGRMVFALLNNPRHSVGMMVCDGPNKGSLFGLGSEMQNLFHKYHFHCEGQLHDLIQSSWYEALCREPPVHD